MDEKNINTFNRAKRQQQLSKKITLISIFIIVFYIVSLFLSFNIPYMEPIVIAVFFGSILVNSDISPYSFIVKKSELLDIIEDQINNDPQTLEFIAKQKINA